MTLDYYRIFYYVAKYKSFSKAARMLDNNQPNITRCMNILESELDCKLLKRSHKGITLTPEGNTLYSQDRKSTRLNSSHPSSSRMPSSA